MSPRQSSHTPTNQHQKVASGGLGVRLRLAEAVGGLKYSLNRSQLQAQLIRLATLLLVAGAAVGQQDNTGDMFAPSRMTEMKLEGLRVRLGEPIQITESMYYSYIPTIARFPSGELMVTYSVVPDTNENSSYVSAFQISSDGGKTWGRRHEIIPEHQPMIYMPREDGSLAGIPAHLFPQVPGDMRNFQAAYVRFEDGGDRVITELGGVRVVDWPWNVDVVPRLVPRADWYVNLFFDGTAMKRDGRWLATGYGTRKGDSMYRSLLFSSEDEGRTWRYFSTIADSSATSGLPPQRVQGPSETSMVELGDGDLMAVFRVGNGKEYHLHRAYSADGGRTWSRAEPLPAYSVEPSMARVENGVIALSVGRPGIRLWLSGDSRAQSWQDIDVVKHHNRKVKDATYRIFPYDFDNPRGMNTWSYTELLEVAPNRLLMVYDRIPPHPDIVAYGPDGPARRLSWAPRAGSPERFRVFVLPIQIERN